MLCISYRVTFLSPAYHASAVLVILVYVLVPFGALVQQIAVSEAASRKRNSWVAKFLRAQDGDWGLKAFKGIASKTGFLTGRPCVAFSVKAPKKRTPVV